LPIIGLSLVVQIFCAVHCVRNGRNRAWLMVIIFMPIAGSLAYAFFEIFPYYAAHREVRAAKAAAIRKLDPQREVRFAREALDVADTAANRIALGDALVELGSHRESIEHYRAALSKMPSADRATQLKLARAELESGHAREARTLLETLPESGSPSENDRTRLMLARALQECGDTDRALELYQDLAHRLPGGEAQCRRAALLIELGRPGDAQAALEDVEKLVRRLDRFERNQQRDMYGWAARTLAELRGP
jgi:hypothetical protein